MSNTAPATQTRTAREQLVHLAVQGTGHNPQPVALCTNSARAKKSADHAQVTCLRCRSAIGVQS